MGITLTLGKICLGLDVSVKTSKRGTQYLNLSHQGIQMGNLFQVRKSTWTPKGVREQISYKGDLFLSETTSGLKGGELHPETGLTVKEETSLKTGNTYLTLTGAMSPEISQVFYKPETGTVTIAITMA